MFSTTFKCQKWTGHKKVGSGLFGSSELRFDEVNKFNKYFASKVKISHKILLLFIYLFLCFIKISKLIHAYINRKLMFGKPCWPPTHVARVPQALSCVPSLHSFGARGAVLASISVFVRPKNIPQRGKSMKQNSKLNHFQHLLFHTFSPLMNLILLVLQNGNGRQNRSSGAKTGLKRRTGAIT